MDSQESVIITPSQADIDRLNGYKCDNKWRGHKLYECLDCQYTTVFLQKITKHVTADEHPWAFPGGTPENPDLVEFPDDDPTY